MHASAPSHPPESHNDADSIFLAGVALQQGRAAGGKSWANSVCAFQHFQRAADLQHWRATLNVGVCYLNGTAKRQCQHG